MHFVLESRNYEVRVFAIVRESFAHEVPVLEFLQEKIEHKQYAGSARGFKGLFVRYSDKGRKGLTAEMFHEKRNTSSTTGSNHEKTTNRLV